MQLQNAIQNVFAQLSETIKQLTDEQYNRSSQTLSNATIGQHTRHIIEMFLCLENGYESGVVNYEKRKRDVKIETEKDFALQLLLDIYKGLGKPDKDLVLEATYNEDSDELIEFRTNYRREIAYNLEHTIHHMALIKVGILESTEIVLPDGFGVASSTIKHKKECVQ